MTARELLWLRINRRVATLTPTMAKAITSAWAAIQDDISEATIARLLQAGQIEAVIDEMTNPVLLEKAFAPVRAAMTDVVSGALKYASKQIPGVGSTGLSFNVLSPHTQEAIKTLDVKIVRTLKEDIVKTVRDAIEAGVRSGTNPSETARVLRQTVGLSPSQAEWVRNYRAAAETAHLNKKALGYELRDKRFDASLKKARATGIPLTPSQIDQRVKAFERKAISFNANTLSHTATLDAFRRGQDLATSEAIDAGILDADRMMSEWISVRDDRVRPTHQAADGEVVRFGEPFSTGDVIPGASEWGCRCLRRDFQARNAEQAVPRPSPSQRAGQSELALA